jgi:hypothetical protein
MLTMTQSLLSSDASRPPADATIPITPIALSGSWGENVLDPFIVSEHCCLHAHCLAWNLRERLTGEALGVAPERSWSITDR